MPLYHSGDSRLRSMAIDVSTPSLSRPRAPAARLPVARLIGGGFVLVSLFPWVSFGTNTLDTQPWPLAAGLIFLVVSMHGRVDRRLLLLSLLIPCVMAIGLADDGPPDFLFFRAVFAYSAVPVLYIASYVYLRRYGVPLTLIRVANGVYLAAGLLQLAVGTEVVAGLVTVRTSLDRGVPSLAVEPTYFGLVLLCFTWMLCLASAYRPRGRDLALVLLNLACVVFVAKSSMAIVFLMVAAGLTVLYGVRPGIYAAILGGILVLAVGYPLVLRQTRVGALVELLVDRGVRDLIVTDASINVRLGHAVIPWMAAIADWFLPHGFHAFPAAFRESAAWHGGLFWYGGETHRIMSYAGSFVFELGWLGALCLAGIFAFVARPTRRRVFELAFLFLLLNSAIPVASPFIPLLVLCLYFSPSLAQRPPPAPVAPSGR